ncbi:unnamed protein product [Ascophyllum nodosum]
MSPRSDTAVGASDSRPTPSSRFGLETTKAKLNMKDLRAQIPKECFEKNFMRSFFYMLRDMACVLALQYLYPHYVAGNWALTFVWWNLTGFMLWALFVVGHDCGHSTFSNYPWVNAVCGHLCHAPLLVPFWPWAKSHNEHHKYHNHVEKDMSYPWFGKEQFEQEVDPLVKFWLKTPLFPLTAFLTYLLLGWYDGSHFNPFSVLFWTRREQVQCAVSTTSVVMMACVVAWCFEFDCSAIVVRHVIPLLIMNYWLVMVTYLQHHEADTKTFDDEDFHFASAAMETVDRSYGWGIDDVHHNITDGHVVHHLFFTKIPHYNLKKATVALRPYLEALGVYRHRQNPHFLWVFVRESYRLGFYTHSKAHDHRAKMHFKDSSRKPGAKKAKGAIPPQTTKNQ